MSNKRIWATLDPFIEHGDILGRKVANAGFLTALLHADPFDAYHFFLGNKNETDWLAGWLADHFPAIAQRNGFFAGQRESVHQHLATTHYHCFHLSDCLTRAVPLARVRNAYSPSLFPITGPTHSLSYERFMPLYFSFLWEGTCARDAIIVTSRSAKAMLQATFSRLRAEYGLPPLTKSAEQTTSGTLRQPHLAHIPLGIDTANFPALEDHWDATTDDSQSPKGKAMRDRLGLTNECVFLCLARISPASKMDILPALAALKRAQAMGLSNAVLVLAGWAEENDPLPQALQQYAQAMGVRLLPFIRPTTEECRDLYAAADIFLSPSDNIQETFGLTIAEAGGSGLPVIASDFDGYRDIVVHEETGLLIPTLGFSTTAETNTLAGMWFDNQYHLKLAQQVAVDVPKLAHAMALLGTDVALRTRMGHAARKRIRELFSWQTVIEQHVTLWDSLSVTALSATEEAHLRTCEHPLRMDFARDFKGHFTSVLDTATANVCSLQRTELGNMLYKGILPPLQYAGMDAMLDKTVLRRILLATRKPVTAAALLDSEQQALLAVGVRLPIAFLEERIAFTLLWALKQDYIELI